MFLDEKTVLEIWLNPGLNLTIFRGTGPRTLDLYAWVESLPSCCFLQWTCIPTRRREVAFFDALCCWNWINFWSCGLCGSRAPYLCKAGVLVERCCTKCLAFLLLKLPTSEFKKHPNCVVWNDHKQMLPWKKILGGWYFEWSFPWVLLAIAGRFLLLNLAKRCDISLLMLLRMFMKGF